MDRATENHTPLHGWTVIGLRASMQQDAVRRAAQRVGAGFISLPGLRLRPAADAARAARDLRRALDAPWCLFSSPAAVRFADRLVALRAIDTGWLAIGSGTARALRRAGCREVAAPAREMHSEGVLALPQLNPPPAQLGLVTAPGGRGEIQRRLRESGCELRIAEVYRRTPAMPTARARAQLRGLRGPAAVLVSSGEALHNLIDRLDASERAALRAACAVCASERLRQLAIDCGFAQAIVSASTRPSRQLAELRRYADARGFR